MESGVRRSSPVEFVQRKQRGKLRFQPWGTLALEGWAKGEHQGKKLRRRNQKMQKNAMKYMEG